MNFKSYWGLVNKTEEEILIKSSDKLSKRELIEVQHTISRMQAQGKNASSIIKYLQDHNAKLGEKYKAERAFWTEVKRLDSAEVGDAASDIDIDTFRVLLSPNACEYCRKKTHNGSKVFKSEDFKKGEGHVPPFHPNCYCVIIPR